MTDNVLAELAAGRYPLKLSQLGKRTEVRATPVRDTEISRWYHNRIVKRKIKANGFPIIGSYGTPDASGEHIAVHVDVGTDAGIPTDYWWLTAADYYWEAYQPVEIDTP